MSCMISLIFYICVGLVIVAIVSKSHEGSRNIGGGGGGMVVIDGREGIAKTDDDFICATLDWWPPSKCDYGTCSWGQASILNLDLSNPILLNAVKAFSPLKIRLGGTLQDNVIYETEFGPKPCTEFTKDTSAITSFSQGCLSMVRWDELNIFLKKSGAVAVFGLNALNGKIIKPDRSTDGNWNSSNAESLIRYTIEKGYQIYGWELGNELSGTGIQARTSPEQYAIDIHSLRKVVHNLYKGFETKPLVIAPDGFFDANWLTKFINKTSTDFEVVTHHIYNLGAGVDEHLIDRILDPKYLEGGSSPFRNLQKILKESGNRVVAWVGEAGGAYNSGHHLVTNAFVFSFWYLDQLGMSSSYDTKTYCRQSLIGGNYGLLNTTTFVPNPDYYSALLWHRLMGSNVLSVNFNGTNKIRAYAHCSKKSKGITLLLINLDGHIEIDVNVSIKGIGIYGIRREEYHLTAPDGNLHSQIVLLNGKKLELTSSGYIPDLNPITESMLNPIRVDPYSIVFVHIPGSNITACV